MARLESEIRQAFERRLAADPARPDLRARVSGVVAERSSRGRVWQVTAAAAGLLVVGAIAFYGLLARHSQPAPIVPLSPGVLSPTPSVTATSALSSPSPVCLSAWGICTASSATGNFDGSAQNEVLTASPIRDGSGAILDWLLQASLPGGHSVSARLSSLAAARGTCPAINDVNYAVVLGAANFAGPSRDFAFIEVNRGASTQFGILVGLEGNSLRLATVANGAERCQRIFPFSGSVSHGNGLACGWRGSTPVLWVRQVADNPPIDYAHYDWYQATYTWQGLGLYLLSLDHAVITNNDTRFMQSYRATCGSISTPG